MRGKTFKDVLDEHRGIGPGFDLVRVGLALLIFYGHAGFAAGAHAHSQVLLTAAGDPATSIGGWEGWMRPIITSYVPAFFAVSGFLVTGSALRTRVTSTFLAFRVLRLLPALLVEVSLSAIVLGYFFTNLSAGMYFSSTGFYQYFGNIIGLITFDLPGVFLNNPVHAVNVNLWTLPSEFDVYVVTAFLMATSIFYNRKIMTILFVVVTAIFLPLNILTNFSVTPTTLAPIAISYYFFVGAMFYHWREYVLKSWGIFLAAGILAYVFLYGHHAVFVAPIFLAYCILFVGMLPIPKIPFFKNGDYSYGIYLYGFPITQAVVELVPHARGNGKITFVVAIILTSIFAALSWHWIEKPALTLKRRLPKRYFPATRTPIPVTPDARAQAAE